MMGASLRRLVLYLFVGGVLYHLMWMWTTRVLRLQGLPPALHLAFLYAIPLVLAIVAARVSGVLAGGQSSVPRWLLVVALGLVVPLLALQLVGAVSCVVTRDCL
jgi:hypothetical protein